MWSIALQQRIRRNAVAPAACFDACNNANLEAQTMGKSPSICESQSTFFSYYTDCLACLQEHPSGDLSGSIDDSFKQFSAYCESIGVAVPEAITTTVVVTLDNRIVTIPITTVLGAASYVSNTLSSNFTTSANLDPITNSTRTTSFSPTLTSPTASLADTPSSSNSSSHSKSQPWIAGAAVGSIAGVFLLVALPAFVWYYRRRQRRQLPDPFEKPQLHSDSIPRQELDGQQIGELEAPPAELMGTEQVHELPDTNEQHPGKVSDLT